MGKLPLILKIKYMLLKQTCFLNIKNFSGNPSFRKGNGIPGVYLWGFSLEKADFKNPSTGTNFFPYYVGKSTKCLYSRTYEHICNLMGGGYSIFDIKRAYANGTPIGIVQKNYQKASKIAAGTMPVGGGPALPAPASYADLLYFPEGPHLSMKYLTDPDIKNQIDWMLKHFCIMFFEPEKNNKTNLESLEKHIGNLVGYDRLITKSYKKPNLKVEVVNKRGNIALNSYDDLFKNCIGEQ